MLKYVALGPHHGEHWTRWANNFLPNLINLAPTLEELTLMFDDKPDKPRRDQEALMTAFSELSRSAEMPCLRCLDLRNATVRYADLLRLWRRVRRTISEIRLLGIGLVDGTWAEFFRQLQDGYGRQVLLAGDALAMTAPSSTREVRVKLSLLVEKSVEDGDGGEGNLGYQPTGVVVFNRHQLARCWHKCLRLMGEDRRQRICRHVSLSTTLALGEALSSGTASGIRTMLDSVVVTTEELAGFWAQRPQSNDA
jgi:hypothetical protein